MHFHVHSTTSERCDLTLLFDFSTRVRHTPKGMQRTRINVPDASGTKNQGEYAKFINFMKRLVAVPHGEIKAKLDAEKKAKARKSERTSASRASISQD
jgi:hypothetical protein